MFDWTVLRTVFVRLSRLSILAILGGCPPSTSQLAYDPSCSVEVAARDWGGLSQGLWITELLAPPDQAAWGNLTYNPRPNRLLLPTRAG